MTREDLIDCFDMKKDHHDPNVVGLSKCDTFVHLNDEIDVDIRK